MRKFVRLAVILLTAIVSTCFVLIGCGGDSPSQDDSKPVSITLSGMKTSFECGEEFSAEGMVVTVTDTDGNRYEASGDSYTVDSSAYVKDVVGEYVITVKLKNSDVSESYKVTASERISVTDVELLLSGMKTQFEYGEEFSIGGLTVKVKRSNNTEYLVRPVDYICDSSAFDGSVVGEYTITVKLKDSELKKSYNVTVEKNIVHDWNDDGALKILMIGNSFSDDTLEHAWNVAASLGIKEIYFGGLYIGGCTLDTHRNNAFNDSASYEYHVNTKGTWTTVYNYKMSDAIKLHDWDFISIQQASGSSGMPDTYSNLDYMVDYIKRTLAADCHAKIVWNLTWAYQQNSDHSEFYKYGNNQQTMYNKIVETVKSEVLVNDGIEAVIPCGTAIQNARTSYLGDTFTRDGYHLSLGLGRYIASLTLIHSLTGLAIDDIAYAPSGVEPDEKAIAVESVKNAVKTPYAVTQSSHKA